MVSIAEPNVRLLAETGFSYRVTVDEQLLDTMSLDYDSTESEDVIEFAGRACYRSFHKPNDATRRNEDYLRSTVLEKQHWSIAEHASATFYITGVSRAFTHELIRHRHLSYSQLSQRFVDESEARIVIPPAVRGDDDAEWALRDVAEYTLTNYKNLVEILEGRGLPRKRAREAARAVLPNMIETEIVVTGNLRAWHQFCERRTAPDADAEMQEVASMIYKKLGHVSPVLFPDKEWNEW